MFPIRKRILLCGFLVATNAGCANICIPGGGLLPLLLFVEEKTPPSTLSAQEKPSFLFPQDEEFFLQPESPITLPLYGFENARTERIVAKADFRSGNGINPPVRIPVPAPPGAIRR